MALLLSSIASCAIDGQPSTTTTAPRSNSTSTEARTATTDLDLGSTTTTESTAATSLVDEVLQVRVQGGTVVGGSGEIEVEVGSEVRFVVVTDVTDHVHVHGYDLFFDVSPGEELEIEFVADVPGVFEVELEDSGILLVELEVS